MAMFDRMLEGVGRGIVRILQKEPPRAESCEAWDPAELRRLLQPADVILIEGKQKLSAAIKYLTQSTWSHAAFHVGDAVPLRGADGEAHELIEVDVEAGCRSVPLAHYCGYNIRICRPVRLVPEDRRKVIGFMVERIGTEYDLRNIVDLMRYLLPTPPVPSRWRRRMLALGSGAPTRAICSTLIAQAFEGVLYPILPTVESVEGIPRSGGYSRREIYHIRHHSLFVPRDFDLSPYFAVVKPTLERGFDYKAMQWVERQEQEEAHSAEPPAAPKSAA